MIRVALDTREWNQAINRLGPKEILKASIRAVTRTGKNSKTAWVREIAKNMGLKQSVVRDRIFVSTAKTKEGGASATLSADSRKIPLIDFGARGRFPSRGKGSGVRAKLAPPGAGTYPSAFIAQMPSTHKGVYQRSTTKFMRKQKPNQKPRQAIYELMGPSIAHVAQNTGQVARDRANEMLSTNFQAELNYLVQQAKQR